MTIVLYDTTLRDGSQREDISFSCDDKLAIVRKLDEFGIHYIEGGWPGSNGKDVEFFNRAKHLHLQQARLSAFGSTRRKHTRCDQDANLIALLEADTPTVTLFGKSWDFQVTQVLETTLEENLAMIHDSVAYLKQAKREVVFDAEHFFDGFIANPNYALKVLQTAVTAGADHIVLCETNGGKLPWQVAETVEAVKTHLPHVSLGIHAHNDSGCAVANSLMAIRAGCTHVQGTINGYGERVGNANLITIMADLQLKMDLPVVSAEQLKGLTRLSAFVAEVANLQHDNHQPFVGYSAFAHKGGVHVAAVLKAVESYQHIDPSLVGNQMRAVVSELSGRGNLVYQARLHGMEVSREQSEAVLQQIKSLEHKGFTFEAADASVDLLLYRAKPDYRPPFKLIDFMVVAEQRQDNGGLPRATVKVAIGDDIRITAADGNGPVDALASALRKALCDVYPQVNAIRLTDYKVRILDSAKGTAATTRVLIDFQDGTRSWTTVGASTNIIEASWRALSDSMEYALLTAS